jgi:uncharacterized membrane protein
VTPLLFMLVVVCECCSVAGQILFKHAMGGEQKAQAAKLAGGAGVKAVGFFLWLGLLSKFDVSYLFPFEGVDRIILVLAAWIFLKEKMSVNLWVGVALISAGIVLVSRS